MNKKELAYRYLTGTKLNRGPQWRGLLVVSIGFIVLLLGIGGGSRTADYFFPPKTFTTKEVQIARDPMDWIALAIPLMCGFAVTMVIVVSHQKKREARLPVCPHCKKMLMTPRDLPVLEAGICPHCKANICNQNEESQDLARPHPLWDVAYRFVDYQRDMPVKTTITAIFPVFIGIVVGDVMDRLGSLKQVEVLVAHKQSSFENIAITLLGFVIGIGGMLALLRWYNRRQVVPPSLQCPACHGDLTSGKIHKTLDSGTCPHCKAMVLDDAPAKDAVVGVPDGTTGT